MSNNLLPIPDERGHYRYPDGSAIWPAANVAGKWVACWAPGKRTGKVMLRGHESYPDRETTSYFDSPEEAARILAEGGEGPGAPSGPDDGTLPTTKEWLEEVGLPCRAGWGVRVTPLLSLWDSSSGWHLFFHNGAGDAFMPEEDTNGPVLIAHAPTRDHVRRMAAVFGFTLKEPTCQREK